MFVNRGITCANDTWLSRIGGRKLRNPAPDRLSSSDAEMGDFADHEGDWCPNGPDATLITSKCDPQFAFQMGETWHQPVIDLDLEHLYYPSSTPGHGALMINVLLTEEQHDKLLDVLEECGIIQSGFREASRQRGYAALRTPWTDKVQPPPCDESDPDPMADNVFDC